MLIQNRIVTFSLDDLIVDPDQVGEYLTDCCAKGPERLVVSGVCQTGKNVYFPLAEAPTDEEKRYVVAPFSSTNDDDVIADLYVRWRSGFITRGLIQMDTTFYGLFETAAEG